MPILAAHYRREALEEAAGVCDVMVQNNHEAANAAWARDDVEGADEFTARKAEAEYAAWQIRALMEKPND